MAATWMQDGGPVSELWRLGVRYSSLYPQQGALGSFAEGEISWWPLSMKARVMAAVISAFWDLVTVIHAVVTFRLYYCNSFSTGHLFNLTQKLQVVQNTAACMLSASPLQMPVQTAACELHHVSCKLFTGFAS